MQPFVVNLNELRRGVSQLSQSAGKEFFESFGNQEILDADIKVEASVNNRGFCYVAISAGTTPDTPPKSFAIGDTLVSNSVEWIVIPSGDDPVTWSQITNKPTTVSGYGITDAITGSGNIGTDTKPIKIVNGVATAVTNELVDVSSAQTVGGAKTFTGLMKASGQGTYDASDTTRVLTIGSLQASSDVVHTTGNETVTGDKTMTSLIIPYNGSSSGLIIDRNGNVTDGNTYNLIFQTVRDKNGLFLLNLWARINANGKVDLYSTLRNADGTQRSTLIA